MFFPVAGMNRIHIAACTIRIGIIKSGLFILLNIGVKITILLFPETEKHGFGKKEGRYVLVVSLSHRGPLLSGCQNPGPLTIKTNILAILERGVFAANNGWRSGKRATGFV